MESGTVKWFDEEKGYGCISRENGDEVLVPISAIQATSYRSSLKPGEIVQFKLVERVMGSAADIAATNGTTAQRPLLVDSIKSVTGASHRGIRYKLGIRGPLKSDADLVALVEERLPVTAISALMEHGVLEKEIYSVIVPRRTLQHRRARKERLSREESDRAVRLARLVTLTENVFGDHDSGMHWLRSSKKRFDGRTPMAMMETEAGSRLVEEALYQIDEGMAA